MFSRQLLISLLIVLSAFALAACAGQSNGDDDHAADDDATVDDDLSDDDLDDDTTPDDDADDDTQDDDAVDDDASDDDADDDADDDLDDDSVDDDTVNIYADLLPTGPLLKTTFGICSHLAGGTAPNAIRDLETNHLAEAGLLRVRRDFSWSDIEPAKGEWNWDQPDGFYQEALDHGFAFDALLDYGVGWAMPNGSPSEIDPADFAEFAGQVAARYCEHIKQYEVWNEENSARFWAPQPDPERYGLLLKAAYTAVKNACPDAQVVFGGLAPYAQVAILWDGVYPFFDDVAGVYPDICDSFDIMAIHPYTFAQTVAPELDFSLLTFTAPDITGQTADIRAKMANAGCGDKPVIWNEWGWPSIFISNERQAHYLARGFLLGAKESVTGYYWYTFWDGSGGAFPITEDYFGLFAYPPESDTPKPRWFAYQALTGLLSDMKFAGDLSAKLGLSSDVYALAFADDDLTHVIVALWDGRFPGAFTPVSLPFPAGATDVQVYAEDGATLPGPWSDPLSLTLTGQVVYVEFAKSL